MQIFRQVPEELKRHFMELGLTEEAAEAAVKRVKESEEEFMNRGLGGNTRVRKKPME